MKVKKIQAWYNALSIAAITILITMTLSKGCGGSATVELIKEFAPNTEVVLRIDTVTIRDTFVEVRVDSFYQDKIVYLDKIVPSKPDTVYILEQDTISLYAGEVEDTTLTITYEARTKGELLDLELGYLLKPPSIIERTITETVTETNTITKKVYRGGLYIGSGVRYEPNILKPILTTDLGYLTRKGWYFGYSFEPTTKSHKLNFKRRIF